MQNKKKFDWKKLVADVIKVALGALTGWLGGGSL